MNETTDIIELPDVSWICTCNSGRYSFELADAASLSDLHHKALRTNVDLSYQHTATKPYSVLRLKQC